MTRPVSTLAADTLKAGFLVAGFAFAVVFLAVFGWASLIQADANLTAMNEALGRAE